MSHTLLNISCSVSTVSMKGFTSGFALSKLNLNKLQKITRKHFVVIYLALSMGDWLYIHITYSYLMSQFTGFKPNGLSTKYSSRRDGKDLRAAPHLQERVERIRRVGKFRGKGRWKEGLSVLVRCSFPFKETCFTMYLPLKNTETIINTCVVFNISAFQTSP